MTRCLALDHVKIHRNTCGNSFDRLVLFISSMCTFSRVVSLIAHILVKKLVVRHLMRSAQRGAIWYQPIQSKSDLGFGLDSVCKRTKRAASNLLFGMALFFWRFCVNISSFRALCASGVLHLLSESGG